MVWLGGTACAHWRKGLEVDPLARDLEHMDRLFSQRVSQDDLRASIELAENLLVTHGPSPKIHWRLARSLEALAYGHVPEEEGLYMEAMEWGRRCLDSNHAWASQTHLAGKVTRHAAQRLTESDLACLEALLVPWIRRVEGRGVSAAIDLEALGVLAARSRQLDAAETHWIPPWSQAMVLSLRPQPSADDVKEALGLFAVAGQREPELATPNADALALRARVGSPGSPEGAPYPVHASHLWSLENRRAVERQLALLEP